MKKKSLVYLIICLIGAMILVSCSNSPKPGNDNEESDATASDINIKVSEESHEEKIDNPLTLEQAKQIVSDSETAKDDKGGRLSYIISQFVKVQQNKPVEGTNGLMKDVFYLYDDSGKTNDRIEIERRGSNGTERFGSVFYVKYDDSGTMLSEEVLYNTDIDAANGLTLDKVMEIVKQSETEEVKQKYASQNEFIYNELTKIQNNGRQIGDNGELYYVFILESESMDKINKIAMLVPSFESDSGNSFAGDTKLYVETEDAHENILTKELIYEVKVNE